MKSLTCLWLCWLLAACASAPVVSQKPETLFRDALFSAPSERVDAADIFTLDKEMQNFLDHDVARKINAEGKVAALVDALYESERKKFRYDAARTRSAAEVFHLRSGNCLSYSIMTAAFARELRLPVQFHTVSFGEVWDRNENIEYLIGHVNLTLGEQSMSSRDHAKTVDFAAVGEARGDMVDDIGEDIVVAMYMNNRAAEALAANNLNDAYWWARSAVEHAPAFTSAYNTLGVVYSRHRDLAQAELVFRHVLEREPDNVLAMSNLAQVLTNLGRVDESKLIAIRLAQIQPNPPYFFFNRGLVAMKAGDFKTAKIEFTKEVNRASYNHQFHFWLALANYYLGNMGETRKQLTNAMENSPNAAQHDLYAAKLETMKSYGAH
jgi:Flp pilus assembly protein TadD